MSGLNPAMHSDYPELQLTQLVSNFNEVPAVDHSNVRCLPWLPNLEDYLRTQARSTVMVKSSPVEDTKNARKCSTATSIVNYPPKASFFNETDFNISTTTNIQESNQSLLASGSIFPVNDINIVPTLCTHKEKINAPNNIDSKNIYTTKISTVEYSTAEDNLCGQIAQLGEFGRKVSQNHVNSSEECDFLHDGITMEVIDFGEQAILRERGNPIGELLEDSSVAKSSDNTKSPKVSRKSTDIRRRRKKANEREKHRIVVLKSAMNVLKNAVPAAREKTKITKLEVLQLARDYISSLRLQLMEGSVIDDPSYS